MIYGFINRQELKIKAPKVVADTIDYLEAEFKFETTDWDGLQKFAHFESEDNNYIIPLTDDKINKKDHLNLSEGSWRVWLHGNRIEGEDVDERITTNAVKINVLKSGVIDGEPFPEITPSFAEQVFANAQQAVEIANSVRKDADEGKFDGSQKVLLYENANGLEGQSYGGVTINDDIDNYDYLIIDTNHGTFPVYKCEKQSGYWTGGTVASAGGGGFYISSVCLDKRSDVVGVYVYENAYFNVLSGGSPTWPTTSTKNKLYRITGVKL